MNFAENLKRIRKEKNLSQGDLANKLGTAQSTVGMWESGNRTPKLDELSKLARILNASIAEIIGENGGVFINGEKIKGLSKADLNKITTYIRKVALKKK